MSQLTADDFEQQIGTEFTVDPHHLGIAADGTLVRLGDVYPADAAIKLELVKVTRRAVLSDDLPREPLKLRLRGSHEVPLFDNVHLLVHETLGEMALLLTAVNVSPGVLPEKHPGGRFYECVIS